MMEKTGVSNDGLRQSLADEEANLMQKIQRLVMKHEKTAEERVDEHNINGRLATVRAKLYEIDGKNIGG